MCTNIEEYIDKKSNTANIRALSEAIKNKQKVKLRLGLRAKNLLLEEYPLAAKDITRKGAYWILETGVYDYAGVCRFYCGLADDIEILGSPELEAYVQEYAREHIVR